MPHMVVTTATLSCDSGSAPAPLICSGFSQVEALFRPVAVIADHVLGTNIFPFGVCRATGRPCIPCTPEDWTSGTNLMLGGASALREDATLGCKMGGTIHVIDPGPHSVNMHELIKSFESNLSALIGDTPPALVPELMETLAQAGLTAIPAEVLQAVINRIELEAYTGNHSAAALKNLRSSVRILKGLKAVSGNAIDVLQIVQALSGGDFERAAKKTAGLGAGLAAAGACESALSGPALAGGPWGEAAAGLGCAGFGAGVGFGVEKTVGDVVGFAVDVLGKLPSL